MALPSGLVYSFSFPKHFSKHGVKSRKEAKNSTYQKRKKTETYTALSNF
jgi:hypothetical protein